MSGREVKPGSARETEARRIVDTWARDAAAFARKLADIDPSWRSEVTEVAGGVLVLCGRGMYVNRAMAVGLDAPLSDADWELVEERSRLVGVPPAIEITVATHPSVREAAEARGYRPHDVDTALVRGLDLSDIAPPDPTFDVVPANRGLLPVWQETAACGWGHSSEEDRRASDVFARTAALIDGERFTLVRHAGSGRPLGCASLTIRDCLATLGGMSTLPEVRGQGVQATLIRHRLRVAAATGCDLAASTAVPGSVSERNLLRHGFRKAFTITTWARTGGAGRTARA